MSVFERIARSAMSKWRAWRLERRFPELAALRKAEAERRRQHRPTKDIQKTRRALVHAALAAERRV